MKKTLVTLVLLVSNAHASVMFIQRDEFKCSDGKSYDVARHYQGGWGPGKWSLVAFCGSGTLKQKTYGGRVLDPRQSHTEIEACMDADSPAIRSCFEEFKVLNKVEGKNELPAIVHAKAKDSADAGDSSDAGESGDAGVPDTSESSDAGSSPDAGTEIEVKFDDCF